MTETQVYRTCPIKRNRRSRATMTANHEWLITAVIAAQPVTVRQAFYLAVVGGIIEKTERGYKQVQRDLLHLRRAGLLPYSAIADATRWMRKPRTYDGVEDALHHVACTYRKALWADQPVDVELWLEKDT